VPRHPVDQIPLHEHELTLSVSYRLKTLLEVEGAEVCVTRNPRADGGGLVIAPYDYTGDGRVRTQGAAVEDGAERIQPRIDVANGFGAEILVSVHFNGSDERSLRGSEVFYSDTGPRQAEGRRLAVSVLAGLLAEMRDFGYQPIDRGIKSDRYQRYTPEEMRRFIANHTAIIRANGHDPANCGDCYRLVTLGNNPMSLYPGNYAGVMAEVEFLSNPDVVEGFILRPESLDVIAQGLFRGIKAYFETD
jgi:N-acetylmuramoyl-L-alanine amidase